MASKGFELVQLANNIVVDATGTITTLDIDPASIAGIPQNTGELPEHVNLYYTDARADARVTKSAIDALNVDADTLDGLDSAQFLRSDADDTTTGNLTVGKNIKASGGFIINSSTINDSYAIANGENAMSTGPIVLGSGVTITLDPGSRWVVI